MVSRVHESTRGEIQTMKKLSLALAILLATATLVAQAHPASHEKKVSDEITISRDIKVGSAFLAAGKYKIECDHVRMVFTNLENGKKLDIPCESTALEAKKTATEVYISTTPDGVNHLDKMYLRGSAFEHIFKN
jgi:hypothetical protein